MDAILGSFMSGLFGPPLGQYMSRFSYWKVIFISLVLGMFIDVALSIYLIASIGVDGFYAKVVVPVTRLESADVILIYLSFPLLAIVMGIFLRSGSRAPNWKEAEAMLIKDGFHKGISEDGSTVTFTKESNSLIAKNTSPGREPTKIEWWRDGERKGEIFLRKE